MNEAIRRLIEAVDAHMTEHVWNDHAPYSTEVEMQSAVDALKGELAANKEEQGGDVKGVRPCVQWFARQMEAKLRANDHRGGWIDNEMQEFCFDRLDEEVKELKECQYGDDRHNPDRWASEAADVANFAMMLADMNGPRIGPAAKEEQEDPYRPRFRSAASGLWYTDYKAAGDIDIVEVGGVKFFPPGESEEEQGKVEPVAWMWRWTNPANDPSARPWETAWKHLTIADCAAGQTLDNKIAELRGYVSDNGVAQYEVIPVYTHPPTKGLDVEGVMRLVEEHLEPMATEILGHYIISGKSRLRKALEERLTK